MQTFNLTLPPPSPWWHLNTFTDKGLDPIFWWALHRVSQLCPCRGAWLSRYSSAAATPMLSDRPPIFYTRRRSEAGGCAHCTEEQLKSAGAVPGGIQPCPMGATALGQVCTGCRSSLQALVTSIPHPAVTARPPLPRMWRETSQPAGEAER